MGGMLGCQLGGRTLGVVGISGAIGSRVARVATALGMQVVGVRSTSSRAELEHLLQSSHVVTLHVPLTPATRHLIGRAELALMRRDALLINTSRADVIDRDALEWALGQGWLRGVGLDVHWVEPADPSEPLYRYVDCLC